MTEHVLKIGNASGFWGDDPRAAQRLVAQQPDLDILTLDYLAELSLSIMAIQRDKDPSLGYARDFIDVTRSLAPYWKEGRRFKVVANAGGLNPDACGRAIVEVLRQAGCHGMTLGIVSGDDVLPQLRDSDPLFDNLDTSAPFDDIRERLITANAYLGAQPIADTLRQGADIVITGRVADPSLTVGPCIAHFGWKEDDWNEIAGATVAGHLIECGTQVTGGISTHWMELPDPGYMGFPVVEMRADGSCIVTKPPGTGGAVTERSVKEQLLYEIGDPEHYLSPDATVSFLSLAVTEGGPNRVRVQGARGSKYPPTYKVSGSYRDGFRAEGQLLVTGEDVLAKAQRCGEIILQRVSDAGFALERSYVECLGANAVVPGLHKPPEGLYEIVLRIAVADQRREAVECFCKELAPMVTSGPQGITGYATGRPKVRPVVGYWPCLIPRDKVRPKITMMSVP